MIGVLFDLDGVLIDSESKYTIFWENAEKMFPTGYDNFAYRIKGNNLAKIFNYFPDEDTKKKLTEMIDEFEENMQYDIFPGVISFLEELNKNKIPCAVVTSSDTKKMAKLHKQLPDFKSYFKAIVTGDMVTKSKPNPECFLLGSRKIGVDISNCYIFEDSPSGIEAAIKSGGKVIALDTTIKREDINQKADKIISGFADFSINDMMSI